MKTDSARQWTTAAATALLAFLRQFEYHTGRHRGRLLETYLRRLQRAIEQIGDQQVRSCLESYLMELSARTPNPICEAYKKDNAVVYKWSADALVQRLVLLNPKLKLPTSDEGMIKALKAFLGIH